MKKIILLILCTFYIVITNAQNPVYQWAVGVGGNDYDYGYEVKTDNSGNVYHVGFFTGVCDFDPGPGVFNLTGSTVQDMYLVKYSPTGNFIWAKAFSPISILAQVQHQISMKIDQLGNIYLTGSYRDSIDWDPGPGTYVMPSTTHSIFVVKLNTSGNLVWAKNFLSASTFLSASYCLDIDAMNNVYSTGFFTGTVDFDPGPGVSNLVSNGDNDIYISKLDANGNFVFVKQIGSIGSDMGVNLMIGNGGSIYTNGRVSGTPDLDPGAGTFTFSTLDAAYLLKLDANGNFIWAKEIGAVPNESELDQNNNIYSVGIIGYPQAFDFDPGVGVVNLSSYGYSTTFLTKLDSNGNYIWAKSIKGSMSISYADGNGMAVDNLGNLYAVGELNNGIFDFDPGPAVFNLDGTGSNMFVTKFDSNGIFKWAVKDDGPGGGIPYAVALYGNSSIYSAGRYWGDVDFDPGTGVANFTSNGTYDGFVHKMTQCLASSSNVTQTACNSFTYNSQTYTTSGTYIQILVNSTGCDSLITLNLTINTPNTLVNQTGAILTATATSPATYQWIKCLPFSPISGATSQSYTATMNGSYAVIVTENGCSDTSNCLTVTGVGIIDTDISDDIVLYPNPSDDYIHLEFGTTKNEFTVRLTTTTNHVIFDQKYTSESGVTIPVNHLPTGIYFVQIKDDKRNSVLKFTKK